MAVAIVLGLVWLLRRRSWALLAVLAVSVIVWLVLTPRATTWTAAKLLVLLSPIAVLLACVGAFGRLGLQAARRRAVRGGDRDRGAASDAYLYHYDDDRAAASASTSCARSASASPASGRRSTPDFDEYALYLLREMAPDGPGNSRRMRAMGVCGRSASFALRPDGRRRRAGPALVERMRAIVVRRSPFKSRPPANFALA